jgi:hypothetical protein
VIPSSELNGRHDLLETVYNSGKLIKWDDFTTVRNRVTLQWNTFPKTYDPVSVELRAKIEKVISKQNAENANLYE